MFYRVKSVKPLPDYILEVHFVNGIIKKYDLKPLFDLYPDFKALKEIPGLYDLVKVDVGGYGIIWNDYLDLFCNELWEGELVS